jgi:hypothetical protein
LSRCGRSKRAERDLVTFDFSPGARLQAAEFDRAERNAQQPGDFVTDRAQQSPNLAIFPLGELDDEMRLALRSFSNRDALRLQPIHAPLQCPRRLV